MLFPLWISKYSEINSDSIVRIVSTKCTFRKWEEPFIIHTHAHPCTSLVPMSEEEENEPGFSHCTCT